MGEVGEADGRDTEDAAGCCEGPATLDVGRELAREARLGGCGEVGAGVGPGVGREGRKADELN